MQVVYALASDTVDSFGAKHRAVQQLFADADAKLDVEAREFGHGAHFRVACAADGTVDVLKVRLAHTEAEIYAAGPDLVVSDMYALGHNQQSTKYWMFMDWAMNGSSQGGIAMHQDDELALPQNRSNGTQPSYALSWGGRWDIFLHEGGHTLGAVNDGAPHSSGDGHCFDEYDIMCFFNASNTSVVCPGEHFDCGHDDYFHPYPPNGTYLAGAWNIGACFNGYLVNEGCGRSGTAPATNAGPDVVCVRDASCRTVSSTTTDTDGDLAYTQWVSLACPQQPCPGRDPRLPSSGTTTAEQFSFTPLTSGTYVLELVVHDRRGNVGRDSVGITVP